VATSGRYCICEHCDFRDVVFANLSEDDIQELCNHKEEHSYRKGEIIIHQGEKISYFKYLKSGLVKVYRKTSDDDEQIITITKPFEFVSSMAIFEAEKYNFSVSALEDTVVCVVNLDYIKSLLINNGRFAIGLLTKIAGINDKIIRQCLDIRQRNLTGRVAYVLLYFAKEIYSSHLFDLPVSRKEIADYIGMSTANVIRTLSDFRNDGIIKVFGKTIEITDIGRLELLSSRG